MNDVSKRSAEDVRELALDLLAYREAEGRTTVLKGDPVWATGRAVFGHGCGGETHATREQVERTRWLSERMETNSRLRARTPRRTDPDLRTRAWLLSRLRDREAAGLGRDDDLRANDPIIGELSGILSARCGSTSWRGLYRLASEEEIATEDLYPRTHRKAARAAVEGQPKNTVRNLKDARPSHGVDPRRGPLSDDPASLGARTMSWMIVKSDHAGFTAQTTNAGATDAPGPKPKPRPNPMLKKIAFALFSLPLAAGAGLFGWTNAVERWTAPTPQERLLATIAPVDSELAVEVASQVNGREARTVEALMAAGLDARTALATAREFYGRGSKSQEVDPELLAAVRAVLEAREK